MSTMINVRWPLVGIIVCLSIITVHRKEVLGSGVHDYDCPINNLDCNWNPRWPPEGGLRRAQDFVGREEHSSPSDINSQEWEYQKSQGGKDGRRYGCLISKMRMFQFPPYPWGRYRPSDNP